MDILFLTQIVPFPPDAGPRVKTWHVLRYLFDRGHRVTLVTFFREEEERHLDKLREICHKVIGVPLRRSRIADVAFFVKSIFTGRPFLIERDDLSEYRQTVAKFIEHEKVDVIHADQLGMAQFALQPESLSGKWPATVFDAHNAVWTIVERMKEGANPILKPVLALEASRVRKYEGFIVRQLDHTLAVSEVDSSALRNASIDIDVKTAKPSNIVVIPIAVDTEALVPIHRKQGLKNILTLGTLHYPPNADGIRWFANEVFPLVLQKEPKATLTIIGKNPPVDFIQLAEKFPESIKVTGYVQDLTPYMEAAALVAVPVRAGGGIRVRILEAFARAMPVLTTTIGLEGIEANPGVDVLVADTVALQAEAVLRLFKDEDLSLQLSQNGHRLAVAKYDWRIALQALDEIYSTIQNLL